MILYQTINKNFRCVSFLVIPVLAVCLMIMTTACKDKSDDVVEEEEIIKITLTTDISSIELRLAGSGKATIYWGDGTNKVIESLTHLPNTFVNNYSASSTRTITIAGENITHFNIAGHRVTSLDVSKNTELVELHCANNFLTNLNLRNNTKLEEFHCAKNQLTSLDVSANVELKDFYCDENLLTGLDVRTNILLRHLFCSDNPLNSLDISENIELVELYCANNQLTNLDVSAHDELRVLKCSGNELESLNVNINIALTDLHCNDNKLTSLDVSSNNDLKELQLNHNKLEVAALNDLFEMLPKAPETPHPYHNIYILGNPGTGGCDKNIALNKRWEVYY